MKKLPVRRLLLVLFVLASLASYYQWGMDNVRGRFVNSARASHEHETLTGQISAARDELAGMPDPQEIAEQNKQLLEVATAELAAEFSAFPEEVNSNEVVRRLLTLADESNVTAMPVTFSPWSTMKINDHEYGVLSASVDISGEFEEVVSFIAMLEEDSFETLGISGVRLSVERPEDGLESVPLRMMTVRAQLDLNVYTQTAKVPSEDENEVDA